MKKLVCDRCGFEVTGKEDIELALDGHEAWAISLRARGSEPRGIIPCEHYVSCGGEIRLIKYSRVAQWWRSLMNSLASK